MLATAFFPLINALQDPLPGWPYPAVDDLRVAVVSSDMGLSWGGHPYDEGDGWPDDEIPEGCGSVGDNGQFRTYEPGKTIELLEGVISCEEGSAHCPEGWACQDIGQDGIGLCQPPGDGTYSCPELASAWSETPIDGGPNAVLNGQVACLSALGTKGCGMEQQLQAAATALYRDDQQEFVRQDSLLAVILVTDEEDCSIAYKALFLTPEIQFQQTGKVNLVCGNHPQYLYEAASFAERFFAAKDNRPGSVVVAAIMGVPIDPACLGAGDQIAGCLGHPKMQLEVVEENGGYYFAPACVRVEGEKLVTKARPGRRFVKLVEMFGEDGYAFSICDEDWRPAADEIAEMIATRLAGDCFPEQLPWDEATQTSPCQLFATFTDVPACPFPTDPGAFPIQEAYTDESDAPHIRWHCPLPRLAAPLDCDQVPDDIDGLGWYYCENPAADACPWVVRPAPEGLQAILGRPAAIRCPLE